MPRSRHERRTCRAAALRRDVGRRALGPVERARQSPEDPLNHCGNRGAPDAFLLHIARQRIVRRRAPLCGRGTVAWEPRSNRRRLLSTIAIRFWHRQQNYCSVPSRGSRNPVDSPSRVVRGKELGQGGTGRVAGKRQRFRRKQESNRRAGLGSCLRRGACARRGESSAGDQGQASCHTTHNFMFFFCSYSRNSRARVNGATSERLFRIGDRPSALVRKVSISRTIRVNVGRHSTAPT